MFAYRAAGLTVAADGALPWFPPAPDARDPDVHVHVGAAAPWAAEPVVGFFTAEHRDIHGRPVVSVARCASGIHFQYADGTRFWIDRRASNVWTVWDERATVEDASTYLIGPIISYLLRLRGALALHASAVEIGGAALALVGPNAAGKSTAAAALGRRGCAIVTDDVLRVDEEGNRWIAQPFGGPLRLWPEAERLVLGTRALPPLAAGWDKAALAMGAHEIRSVEHSLPLGAIVCLRPRESGSGAPRVDVLRPAEALVQLAANSSAAHLLAIEDRKREFTILSALVRDVPCASAAAREDPARFPEFVDALLDWMRARSAAARPAL